LYSIWYGKKYIAHSTFAVQGQTSESSLINSAISIANALGLSGAGSSGRSGGYDNNFFATLMQSQRVIKESLLMEGVMDGKQDLMANHYITLYRWREGTLTKKGWNKIPHLKDFRFTSNDVYKMSPLEDSIMSVIYNGIIESNLLVTYDEATPFNDATFTSRNLDFSRNAMTNLLELSSGYYMDNIYMLARRNLTVADKRVDSIGNVLRRLDYRVASLKDISNNLIQQKGAISLNAAARDQSLLSIQYNSAMNNLELAKISLVSNAPILEIIDDPSFATELSQVSKTSAFIVGGIIGMILGGIAVLISRTVKESNRKAKERLEQNGKNHDTAAA